MASFDSVVTAWRAVADAMARFGQGPVAPLRRFLHLYRRRKFSPHEIYFNDLLNPAVADEALELYASREDLIALDQRYALPAYLCLAADKAVLYSVCATAGLPAPTLTHPERPCGAAQRAARGRCGASRPGQPTPPTARSWARARPAQADRSGWRYPARSGSEGW